MMENIKKGIEATDAIEKASGKDGRFDEAVKGIDPREQQGGENMAITFESYDRRNEQIKPVMAKYGIKDFEDALEICKEKGFNPYEIVKGVQPICFENAAWAYTLGAAIAGRETAANAT